MDFRSWLCHSCGNVGLSDGHDGFFYCLRCSAQADDIIDTGVADEDLVGGAIYMARHRRKRCQHLEDEIPPSKGDTYQGSQYNETGSSVPGDFASSSIPNVPSSEDYYSDVRMRYVMGLQIMLELQCETLVTEFKVNPLICGIVPSIWLRSVFGTDVFHDDWADKVIHEAEMQHEGEPSKSKPRDKHRAEPHTMYGKRAVMIWYRSLRKTIPIDHTLAVAFLACHVAREPVLPTDIVKWSLEGKLPYLAAFDDIEKRMEWPSGACPIRSSVMFRPSRILSAEKLELLAASIADSIGLLLPPVNFYAIAYRYLLDLSLPHAQVLPHACRVHDWTMDPGLWLSTDESRFPTRLCVLSMLIVAIRMKYNIHGFGDWERSLSHRGKSSSKDELDAAGLLHHLYTSYNGFACQYGEVFGKIVKELIDFWFIETEYSKDLPTYVQYCKDVVFAGEEPSFENYEEQMMIDKLWSFYQKEKDAKPAEQSDHSSSKQTSKEKEEKGECSNQRSHERLDMDSSDSSDSEEVDTEEESTEEHVREAIKTLKLDMEENRFCYSPPRKNPKRFDYVHYVRKKDNGALLYVAHADYYILLRAFARAAQVDVRIMYNAVSSFEKRLDFIEKRIDKFLSMKWKPRNITCKHCEGNKAPESGSPPP